MAARGEACVAIATHDQAIVQRCDAQLPVGGKQCSKQYPLTAPAHASGFTLRGADVGKSSLGWRPQAGVRR